jgi:hypothetical protein
MTIKYTDVWSFRGSDSDYNHYLVVAKFRKRLLACKQGVQTFDMKIFDLRKLNNAQVKEQHHIKISNLKIG